MRLYKLKLFSIGYPGLDINQEEYLFAENLANLLKEVQPIVFLDMELSLLLLENDTVEDYLLLQSGNLTKKE